VRLELARLLIESKGAESALEILNQAPEYQKPAVPFIVENNWALIALGRRDEARKGVARGMAAGGAPDLLLQDALLKTADRDFNGARASIDSLLRQSPEDVRALGALAQLYRAQNQRAAALEAVREYVARHASSAALQNYLGDLMLAEGKTAEARAAYTAALSANPRFRPPQLALVKLDVSDGKLDAAQRRLSELAAGNPNDPDLWLYMGWVANARKDYPQALTYFRKVVDSDPANVAALNNLAYLLASQTEQLDEALKYAQQVKELAPDNKGVDDTIGWIMYRKGLYKSAVKYLESAAQGATDPAVRYHLGIVYMKLGDKRGEPALRSALKSAPDLPEAAMATQLLNGSSSR